VSFFDRPVDRVLRHVFHSRRDDGGAQARIHCRVWHPQLGRHGDFARKLAEYLRLDGVLPSLAVHDVLEL
jgi:hypothetical protein